MKSSSAVTLVLIGTAGALLGYSAVHRDDESWYTSTQPSSHYSGSGYHGWHYWSGGSGSSEARSGTSRGGFGAAGHAAGS
jgi:hypothetical protein